MKRFYLAGVRGCDGRPICSIDEAAARLHAHWQGVFSSQPIQLKAMAKFRPFVQTLPAGISFEMDYEQVKEMIGRLHDSAPGPDGVPYSAWAALGSNSIHMIKAMYDEFLTEHAPLPT